MNSLSIDTLLGGLPMLAFAVSVGICVGVGVAARARGAGEARTHARAEGTPWGLFQRLVARFHAHSTAQSLLLVVCLWPFRRIYLPLRLKRRHEALKQAMPDLCDLLAAALRSGLALRHALAQIAPRLSEPIQSEVLLLLNEHRTGLALPHAVGRFATRLAIPSAHLFSFCLQMSMHSGGSLSDALLRLSKSMRDQLGLEAKIRALTAQGLLQAAVMLAIPPLLFLVMLSIDPAAPEFFLGSLAGYVVLGLVVLLEALGALWVRKIIRIEV